MDRHDKNKPANKGGRPKKSENDTVYKGYKVYMNKKEHDKFFHFIASNQLDNYSISEILKRLILDTITKNKVTFVINESPKYLFELNKIGSNINQIARKLNSIDDISDKDLNKLYTTIDALSDILARK